MNYQKGNVIFDEKNFNNFLFYGSEEKFLLQNKLLINKSISELRSCGKESLDNL